MNENRQCVYRKDDWKDDKPEKHITQQRGDDSDEESLADLRRVERAKEEGKAKQKAYSELQRQLTDNNMSFLDKIRYDVDNA